MWFADVMEGAGCPLWLRPESYQNKEPLPAFGQRTSLLLVMCIFYFILLYIYNFFFYKFKTFQHSHMTLSMLTSVHNDWYKTIYKTLLSFQLCCKFQLEIHAQRQADKRTLTCESNSLFAFVLWADCSFSLSLEPRGLCM